MSQTSLPDIVKPNLYETATIRLSAPLLHIGSEVQRLTPFEYVSTGDRVYFPNPEQLGRVLHKRGKLQDYIATIESRQSLSHLLSQVFGENWQVQTDLNGTPLFSSEHSATLWTEEPLSDLRPHIRNKYNQPYIPGSSIKGAIRTAIAYQLLKYPQQFHVSANEQVSAIEQHLRQSMGGLKRERGKIGDRLLMKDLFTNARLRQEERNFKAPQGPNTDFMRAIRISDSLPLHPKVVQRKRGPIGYNQPIVPEVMVISHFQNFKAKHTASIFAECIFNVSTTCQITLDHEMLTWFKRQDNLKLPFKNLAQLLKICQEFAQDQWDAEFNYWQDIQNNRDQGRSMSFETVRSRYEAQTCPYHLRLGWGSGLNGTTVSLQLDPKIVQQIRDVCGLKAPNFEAPKTRRIALNPQGELKFPLGWATLKPIED